MTEASALEHKMLSGSGQIYGRITWLTHFSCNFRCTYCFYYEGAGWEILKERNKYFSADEWVKQWERLNNKYGRFVIIVTGGEPFGYPDFIEIIRRVSELHYPINISSNASGDLMSFAELVNPKKVTLSLSFHPQFETLNSFLNKVRFLRSNCFEGCLNFLAYPPFLKDLRYYRERFKQEGEELKVIPFRGIYQGNAYPWSYSSGDLETMGIDNGWFDRIRRKGDYCEAGVKSAILLPDGKVAKCGQMFYNGILGDFFDPEFRLFNEPARCEKEICPCAEDKIFGEAEIEKYG